MKKQLLLFLIASIVLAMAFVRAKAQDTTKSNSATVDFSKAKYVGLTLDRHITIVERDTIPCYFREISGIVKGELMGIWRKGWISKPHVNSYLISNDGVDYGNHFLYEDRKTRVTKPVITYYY